MRYEDDVDPNYHPSQSMVSHFPDDALLRAAGFAIASRPKQGDAVWRKRGLLFTHSEALAEQRRGIR